MSDLSPEAMNAAQDAAQKVGKYAGRTLIALQNVRGTPVLALRGTLLLLARAAAELANADERIVAKYDPDPDTVTLMMLSDGPVTYVPHSPAELDDDFTTADRQQLSSLLSKWLFSESYPAEIDAGDPLTTAMNHVIDVLEGRQ